MISVLSLSAFNSNNIIACGGLFSDRIAKKDKLDLNLKIVGFRGDYYDLTTSGKEKVKNLIYPVPNPEFPFLGVHFTRMTDGTIEYGPNAVPIIADPAKCAYTNSDSKYSSK